MATYINNPLIDSILAQCIPSLSSSSILVSYTMILWFLTHIYCDTNPWTPYWVLVMVPAHGTGYCDGGWTLLDGSCIPNHDQVDPHLIDASQHNNFVSQIGCPSPTWKQNLLQSVHPYFPYKPMGVGCHMRCSLQVNQHLKPSKRIHENQHVSQCYSFIPQYRWHTL